MQKSAWVWLIFGLVVLGWNSEQSFAQMGCFYDEMVGGRGGRRSEDDFLRELERRARESKRIEDYVLYWEQLKRLGRGPTNTYYRHLDGTENGRPSTPEAQEAKRAFRDAVLSDPLRLGDGFPLLIRQVAAENKVEILQVADHHPRAFEFIPIIKLGDAPIVFLMGSSKEEQKTYAERFGYRDGKIPWEKQHKVKITKPFEVAATNVTVGLYLWVMGRLPPRYETNTNPNLEEPVRFSSWNMAKEFIDKLNEKNPDKTKRYRFLTEAEWELVARLTPQGTTQTPYPWGDKWNEKHVGPRNQLLPVDSRIPTGLRIAGIVGEIFQWVEDSYHEGYGGTSGLITDPVVKKGGKAGLYGVVRGGSFSFDRSFCRTAFRRRLEPSSIWSNSGLRLAREDVQ